MLSSNSTGILTGSILALTPFLPATSFGETPPTVDEIRPKWARCDPIGPEDIYNDSDAGLHFYYISHIEKCSDAPSSSITFYVRNLHPELYLPFVWDHAWISRPASFPLGPDVTAKNIFMPPDDFEEISDEIRVGAMLDYPIRIKTYDYQRPIDLYIQDPKPRISILETTVRDAARGIFGVVMRMIATPDGDEIDVKVLLEPSTFRLGLGALSSYDPNAERLLRSDVESHGGTLERRDLSNILGFGEVPSVFLKEEFLIINPPKTDPIGREYGYRFPAERLRLVAIPIIVLNEDYEPVITGRGFLYVPPQE